MQIRKLTDHDAEEIMTWPHYSGRLAELDYSLRSNGWLSQFPENQNNYRFGAWEEGSLIGFAVINKCNDHEAEFYIALHQDKIGMGLGEIVARQVVENGFENLHLAEIHLRVRSWHVRAIHLYHKLGFRKIEEIESFIDGKMTKVFVMTKLNPNIS